MDESNKGLVVEHLFRRQAGRIVSCLAGLLGSQHLQLAEDAVQESMLRAVQSWPVEGVPELPEAWLFRVAHNYAISALRRSRSFEGKTAELISRLEESVRIVEATDVENSLRDDELRMIFMCCRPDLRPEARIALSLKLVGGFSVHEIARLFLAEEATMAQRLVRAKRTIRDSYLPIAMPSGPELQVRLDSVLDVIYLMFSAGYSAHSGDSLIRNDVCFEAIRLGRLVTASSISAPRADALVALMLLQAARFPARVHNGGDLVLLEEQDRRLWDRELIRQGFYYFDRSIEGAEVSEWHIEAAIAATYARAECGEEIDWPELLKHYDDLIGLRPSPIVALNRAVVVGKVLGAGAALAELKPLQEHAAIRGYYLLPAVRGRLLAEAGSTNEAEKEFCAALECECSEPERRFLEAQLVLVREQRIA